MDLHPSPSAPTRKQANKRRFVVPAEALLSLSVASCKQSDAIVNLTLTAGQIAERLEDTRVIDWLQPFILNVAAQLDTIQETLKAIVEENPNG